jgi:hypothetical protein
MQILRKKHIEKIKFFEHSIKSEQTKRVYRCYLKDYIDHKIGLASCYYKPSDDDFLVQYEKAVNNLTINELGKIKMQVKKLQIENSQLEKLASDVALLKKRWKLE